MHRQHRRGSRPGGAARGQRGRCCWDRNLSSVVRDAPYAVDHLSARSQRPIISCDTCASPPDKKRYALRAASSFTEKIFPQRATEKLRTSFDIVRIVDRTRDSNNRNLRTQIREMFSQPCSSSWNTWCSPTKKSHGI